MKPNEVKWLFEGHMFDGEDGPMIEMLKKMGIHTTVTGIGNSYENYIHNHYKPTDCVVFHGSFQFAKHIDRYAKWVPGNYCNLPLLRCDYYYNKFGDELLNANYVMLPFGELQRRKKWLMEHLSKESKLFIRPSSGFKSFAGAVVSEADWDKSTKLMGFYEVSPEELVVVASPAEIVREWRAVIVENQFVAGSQYAENGQKIRAGIPKNAVAYIQYVLNNVAYRPDAAWTIDICETKDDGYKVVEVGSFSCAGLYHCDPEPIINAINIAASKEWNDIHE
jgi:hypothetical protein